MQTTITKKPDGTVEIPATISKSEISSARSKLVDQAAKTTQVKGFRQGKAPKNAVEENLDETKLNQEILNQLLPQIIQSQIKKHQLKPIANPTIKSISMKQGSDWQFTLQLVQFPQFKLGNYKQHVRSALTASKIWVPGQDKSPSSSNKPQQTDSPEKDQQSLTDKRLKKIFDALLDNIQVPLAPILIEEEVNNSLSRLLNQINKLGLTIEKYVTSLGKTVKSLKKEYQTTAKDNLKLEFILHQIGQDLKISVSDKEIQDTIAAIPDEKTQEAYQKPAQSNYIKGVIRKRKTIDALTKLG